MDFLKHIFKKEKQIVIFALILVTNEPGVKVNHEIVNGLNGGQIGAWFTPLKPPKT